MYNRYVTTTRFLRIFLLSALLIASFPADIRANQAILSDHARFHPVTARQGMVASQEALATQIGVDILKQGGNAVDAAVATGFALAVTLPRAGNLGGGGFMLVHLAEQNQTIAIDYRETAPARATETLFLDKHGDVDRNKATFSHAAVGVPGTVAGLTHALEAYGTLPLRQVMQPAIRLAKEGIIVTDDLADSLKRRRDIIEIFPETRRIFLKQDGSHYQAGERFSQPDLAWSLEQIAQEGADAFYRGDIAKKITAEMEANGGLITADDLAHYRIMEREPVRGRYRDYEILSMPPPSSGGIAILQILNILKEDDLDTSGHNSAATIHLMAEAMKRAFADRSRLLGDPDFVEIPVERLLSEPYAKQLRAQIGTRATPSEEILSLTDLTSESRDTTHFSVMDKDGNIVSNTYTLNFSYGSGIVAEGTGILLNNEMDDFSAKPGSANAYGLLGNAANKIEAGKRPLSSMSPTIVLKDGTPFLATGSPGGSRIITTVLQILLNIIDHDMNPMSATAATRIHHQWLPDVIRVEDGISPDTIRLLEQKGHKVEEGDAMGATQTIMHYDGVFYGAADPRRRGALAAGY